MNRGESSGPLTVDQLHGHVAGVVTRTLAGAIDYAVGAIAVTSTYLGWAALNFLWSPVRFSWPVWPLGVWLILGFVYMIVYLWLAWATTGKTVGGVLMGTRVVSISGKRIGTVRALLRSGFCTAVPIGLFACAATPGSRSLQDIVLLTKVVHHYRNVAVPLDPAD